MYEYFQGRVQVGERQGTEVMTEIITMTEMTIITRVHETMTGVMVGDVHGTRAHGAKTTKVRYKLLSDVFDSDCNLAVRLACSSDV